MPAVDIRTHIHMYRSHILHAFPEQVLVQMRVWTYTPKYIYIYITNYTSYPEPLLVRLPVLNMCKYTYVQTPRTAFPEEVLIQVPMDIYTDIYP